MQLNEELKVMKNQLESHKTDFKGDSKIKNKFLKTFVECLILII